MIRKRSHEKAARGEEGPSKSLRKTPAKSSPRKEEKTPVKSPRKTPAKSSPRKEEKIPAKTPTKSPHKEPMEKPRMLSLEEREYLKASKLLENVEIDRFYATREKTAEATEKDEQTRLLRSGEDPKLIASAVLGPSYNSLLRSQQKVLPDENAANTLLLYGLSTRGTSSDRRDRLHRVFSKREYFRNYASAFYSDDRSYGSEVKGLSRTHVVGEGEYDLEPRDYDSPLQTHYREWRTVRPCPPLEKFDETVLCAPQHRGSSQYTRDLLTVWRKTPEDIYLTRDGRCFVLSDTIRMWNKDLSYWDDITEKVNPIYPMDPYTFTTLLPEEVKELWDAASTRRVLPADVEALHLLLDDMKMMNDLYDIIRSYEISIEHLRSLPSRRQYDVGMWNRRDILASSRLLDLHKRYNLPVLCLRRNDRPSSASNLAISAGCFISSYLLKAGYGIEDKGSEGSVWRRGRPCDLKKGKSLCDFGNSENIVLS